MISLIAVSVMSIFPLLFLKTGSFLEKNKLTFVHEARTVERDSAIDAMKQPPTTNQHLENFMENFMDAKLSINVTPKNYQQSDKITNPRDWIQPFVGRGFHGYKTRIDEKIRKFRNSTNHSMECSFPLYTGEFGYEIAGMIPWAYHTSQNGDCQVSTEGRPGTEYLYYFSKRHTIREHSGLSAPRQSGPLPKDGPLGENPHFGDDRFKKINNWTPPPYKVFFRNNDITLDKPLLIISNKYTMEWSKGPINHIPLDQLKEILTLATPHYHIVYNRFEDSRLQDRNEVKLGANIPPYNDKVMIKESFPSVVLFEELSKDLGSDEVNLLNLYLGSMASKFISVQGGNSVLASFFGGSNVIYCLRGPEINYNSENGGDFSYYYRFSNATISVVRIPANFCGVVRDELLDEEFATNSQFCNGITADEQSHIRPKRTKKWQRADIFGPPGS